MVQPWTKPYPFLLKDTPMFVSLKKALLGTWFLIWISLISDQALAQQADRGDYLKAVVDLMETE